jgi:hypothetical protein
MFPAGSGFKRGDGGIAPLENRSLAALAGGVGKTAAAAAPK